MTSEKLSDDDVLKLTREVVGDAVFSCLHTILVYSILPRLSSVIDVVGVLFMWLKRYISSNDNRKIQISNLHFLWFKETSRFGLKLIINVFEQLLQATKRHIDLQNIKIHILTWPDKLFLSQNFGGCRQSLFRYSGYYSQRMVTG